LRLAGFLDEWLMVYRTWGDHQPVPDGHREQHNGPGLTSAKLGFHGFLMLPYGPTAN
jgi:hypothetical protein